ncbi:MAG: putative DNA binding domain-containing protein [Planctomycetes bacterium]|nr:putative DNA binding domain-containing protein [Planctomycetota bacterium]
MPTVDLNLLAVRESEQVEWKRDVADVHDVVRTLAAFANDLQNLGGGYVVCGAEETRDEHGFQRLNAVGLDASRLREVEGRVLALCRERVSPPVIPIVEELPAATPERRVLVFVMPATGHAHSVRTDQESAYWIRIGRQTREARNGLFRELMIRKGAIDPWDRRPLAGATVADLDLLMLRDSLQRLGQYESDQSVDRLLSADLQLSAFVPSLCVREPMTGVLRPRNFAMLLFGREPQRWIPGAVAVFSSYPGTDRAQPHGERHELGGTLLVQARRLTELLDAQAHTLFDKTDAAMPNAVKYPQRALHEALINSLAHRDYSVVDPTRITVFVDRIEFNSPGSLPLGVDLEALRAGRAGPRWRNQALAWFLTRLQLAQAEGQGIPTILQAMRAEGCPEPVFDADEVRVSCTLPAHPRMRQRRP